MTVYYIIISQCNDTSDSKQFDIKPNEWLSITSKSALMSGFVVILTTKFDLQENCKIGLSLQTKLIYYVTAAY